MTFIYEGQKESPVNTQEKKNNQLKTLDHK